MSPPPDQHRQTGSSLYRRAIVDLAVIAVSLCGIFYLISGLDLFERLHNFSRAHENWELDELIVALLLSVVGVYVFGIRRLVDQRREIKARQLAEREANRLAQVDPLTGLANRRRFEERLSEGLAAIDNHGGGLALMIIDLDQFKPVNDAFGHATGDQILINFSRQAQQLVGTNGLVARIGGDEFAVVLQPLARNEDAGRIAEQLLSLFDHPLQVAGTWVTAGCSIGIAIAPRDGTAPDALIRRANIALYRAKDGGRRICRVFEMEMDAREGRRSMIERDLWGAITDGTVQPFYQPIVDLRSREVTGFEALARWHHPELGEILPRELIEIAEDSGQIEQLSTYLLRRACRDAMAWPSTVRLSFNLSRAQLVEPMLVLRTIRILGETGFNPKRLEIEISENALVSDLAAA